MIERSIFNLKKITLILGTACNFNCIYCVQHENKPRCRKTIKPEVIKWLEHIAFRLPKKFKPTLQFYGGEPLLYRDAIHQIVEHFGDDFNYALISNGSNLTKEDVGFFNANSITFVFSNDGPNTKITRQVDMFEDENFTKLFNQIEHKAIDLVYSALSQDLPNVFKHIEAKAPDTLIWPEELICNSYTDSRLVDFDKDVLLKSYKEMGEDLYTALNSKEEVKLSNSTRIFYNWVKSVSKTINYPVFPKFGVCGSGNKALSVDTEGNIYLCKNFNEKIGTVSDSYETLYDRALELTKKLRDKNLEAKGCFDCPVFYFCKGGCPFEEASEMQKKRCEMTRAKWLSVVSFIDNKLEIKYEDS